MTNGSQAAKNILIIGNGIAGTTAARHIRKLSDHRVTLISSETEEFFSRTALMYIYMGHMTYRNTVPYEEHFWNKNRIHRRLDHVEHVNPEKNTITLRSGAELPYDELIIATGSKPNKFGWKGQDLPQVQGLYSYQDLEKLQENAPDASTCKRAVVVGGGLIGIELAEMLHSRNIPVTFLVREDSFWNSVLPPGESEMINEHILSHGIDLRLNANLDEVLADDAGNVRAVRIKETGEEVSCQVVGLTAGVSPNIEFLNDSGIETDKGVLVDRLLRTNFNNIYSIGDCAQQREAIGDRKPIEAVWYTGRMMGETVAHTICGDEREYKPGLWFNSAKFMDIEYQTYGWVFPEPRENEIHFHWRHPEENTCITINYNQKSHQVIGMNAFGIRQRHEVWDEWISQGKTIEKVIGSLKQSNFDPEFYSKYEGQIERAFQEHQNLKKQTA